MAAELDIASAVDVEVRTGGRWRGGVSAGAKLPAALGALSRQNPLRHTCAPSVAASQRCGRASERCQCVSGRGPFPALLRPVCAPVAMHRRFRSCGCRHCSGRRTTMARSMMRWTRPAWAVPRAQGPASSAATSPRWADARRAASRHAPERADTTGSSLSLPSLWYRHPSPHSRLLPPPALPRPHPTLHAAGGERRDGAPAL
jgi:hypothetical protein